MSSQLRGCKLSWNKLELRSLRSDPNKICQMQIACAEKLITIFGEQIIYSDECGGGAGDKQQAA